MKTAFVTFLLAFAASSASAFVTVIPPKIITTHQIHHQPRFSKLNAQNNNQSRSHQDSSSWLPSTIITAAAAPIISAATIFAFTVASYPSPATAGDITKGSQIFTSTCAGCHAGGNNFLKEKKTLKKEALDKYVGLDETKIAEFFKKSFVHQNQAGGGKMSEEDVADVISYVVTQAVNDKW
uniref:Cytochrome c domain-containing protein n=1 Tax=Skeletonema marinoi TaxID=267567 RepID=A0A7S2KKB1_9STRA|mmetsp:Transcript_14092/g.23579  ORF Transcript_14092/g.23579 Transcript_14092/m.23579 type:complete len:181 (+) Transcript_14092:99-641(+)